MWHVSEYATVELSPADFNAQFYFEDTYVVRWKYKVSLTGTTRLTLVHSGISGARCLPSPVGSTCESLEEENVFKKSRGPHSIEVTFALLIKQL